jgi:hypothetical protein
MIPSPVKSHLLKTLTVCHPLLLQSFSRQLSSALEHRDRSRPYASRLSANYRANYWRVRNGISYRATREHLVGLPLKTELG